MNSRAFSLVVLASIGLTVLFWQPLWTGGGLIGGDTYTYFFPQKTFYSDSLHAGEFPLWNNRVGHGYPLVGESQTGAFYPVNLLAYRTLDVNSAYNAVHLLHYMLSFVFCWLYARRLGLAAWSAVFASAIFTYGWFPPRSCLEWAIVTGAYLPIALWCIESFLQTSLWRYLIISSAVIGIQLLAGHFNLAFITQLVIALYVPLRLWFSSDRLAESVTRRKPLAATACGLSLIVGFMVAAIQLSPSWELKQNSQRSAAGGDEDRIGGTGYDPGYGHLPPMYLMQIVMPWDWYPMAATGELDGVLGRLAPGSINSATNKIEAHLYFGMVPIVLIFLGGIWRLLGREPARGQPEAPRAMPKRMISLWFVLGLGSVVYSTGWLLPVSRYLPGFSFFTGPGRFGIVATLAASLIAASVFDRMLAAIKRPQVAALVAAVVIGATLYDFHWVSRLVTNAYLVQHPPIEMRAESRIAELLNHDQHPSRLLAPGPNLATLTGAAATPVYLGIGPAAYFNEDLRMPSLLEEQNDGPTLLAAPGQTDWLQHAGVTHVLSFKPLNLEQWPVTLVYSGPDRMLNRAWARRQGEPLYLYLLEKSRGRTAIDGTAEISQYNANRVVIDVDATDADRLILTDLMYPGWHVTVDGKPAETIAHEQMYRAVDVPAGKHRVVWSYEPASVYWGAAVTIATLLLLAAVAHIRYWRPQLLPYFDQEPTP